MARDLKGIVKEAEHAAAGIADKTLKVKAFELVMQELLRRELGVSSPGSLSRMPKAASTSRTGRSRVVRSSLTQRLLEVVDGGFLKSPQPRGEIRAELQRRGHHYSEDTIGMALLRLVRKRVLRRIVQTKGKNRTYSYVAN